jgi:hypothetical protein
MRTSARVHCDFSRSRSTTSTIAITKSAAAAFLFLMIVTTNIFTTTIEVVEATPALNHALARDLLPPMADRCLDGALAAGGQQHDTQMKFNFSSIDVEDSDWGSWHDGKESKVFLVEMGNGVPLLDPDASDVAADVDATGWKLRISKAGTIYSLRGAYGEAIPPQGAAHSPWNDEVIQQTMTNGDLNSVANDHEYMIHQGGVYLFDDVFVDAYDTGLYQSPNTMNPPEAPIVNQTEATDHMASDHNVALSCEGNSCSVVSWGQHAHIPTQFDSNALFYTRVANCGSGVIELTMVTHNMATSETRAPDYWPDSITNGTTEFYDLFTMPWMGLRATTFRDVLTTESYGNATLVEPTPIFESNTAKFATTTAGYTIFTEGIEWSEPKPFQLPCVGSNGRETECIVNATNNIQPTIQAKRNNFCGKDLSRSATFGKPVVKCKLHFSALAANDYVTPQNAVFGNLYDDYFLFHENNPTEKLLIRGVLFWSVNYWFMFLTEEDTIDADIAWMNSHFYRDAVVEFEYADLGVPVADNHALSILHGATDTHANYKNNPMAYPDYVEGDRLPSYIIFGRGSSTARDLFVFVSAALV